MVLFAYERKWAQGLSTPCLATVQGIHFWKIANIHFQQCSRKGIPLSLESQLNSALGTAWFSPGTPFVSARWMWWACSQILSITILLSSPAGIIFMGMCMSAHKEYCRTKMEVNSSVMQRQSSLTEELRFSQLNKSEVKRDRASIDNWLASYMHSGSLWDISLMGIVLLKGWLPDQIQYTGRSWVVIPNHVPVSYRGIQGEPLFPI